MDNRYYNYGCPALMQDGKFLTNYLEPRIVDQFIRNTNRIGTAHDYKNFIRDNGSLILEREYNYLTKNNTCGVDGKCVAVPDMNKTPEYYLVLGGQFAPLNCPKK